jgi:putative flippase GtrA
MSSRSSYVSVARFLVSGGSATLLNLCLLWLFVRQLGLWYLGASALSYSVSIGYNFFLQRHWTFNNMHGSMIRQFPQFAVMNLFGLILNTAILLVLVETFGLPLILSQAAASLAVSVLSFLAYRRIFLRDNLMPQRDPLEYVTVPGGLSTSLGHAAADQFDKRSDNTGKLRDMTATAPDSYAAERHAAREARQAEIDGLITY